MNKFLRSLFVSLIGFSFVASAGAADLSKAKADCLKKLEKVAAAVETSGNPGTTVTGVYHSSETPGADPLWMNHSTFEVVLNIMVKTPEGSSYKDNSSWEFTVVDAGHECRPIVIEDGTAD